MDVPPRQPTAREGSFLAEGHIRTHTDTVTPISLYYKTQDIVCVWSGEGEKEEEEEEEEEGEE